MIVKEQLRHFRFHWAWYLAPVLMTFGLCAAIFWGGGTHYWGPLESDLTNQFYPWRVFTHRWFTRGVFPYWDPHMFSGYPTVESQQMLNLNPLHLLSVFLNPKIGLTAFTALNTLIACVGMMWGLRRWGRCSAAAAALGAGLYVFGALFAVRVMAGHITVVSALAWWPLAGLSTLRLVRAFPATRGDTAFQRETAALTNVWLMPWNRQELRRLLAISALAHAMVCLAGAPQYIVYLFYIDMAILVAVARRWTWIAALALVGSVWVLALIVSAPQWLPTLWYLPYTGRALSSGGTTGLVLGPMQNFWLELVMPWPFGDDLVHGHLHFKNVWETATYPGGIALVLSLALLIRSIPWVLQRLFRRGGAIAPVSPLAIAGTMIMLAGLYMMIGGWLPGFGGFREPLKARALVAMGFALMSAATFDLGIIRGRVWTKSLWVAIVVAGLLLVNASDFANPADFRNLIESFGVPMDPLAGEDFEKVLDDPTDAARRYYLAYMAGQLGLFTVLLFLVAPRRHRWAMAVLIFWVGLGDPLFHHARAWVARYPWSRAGLPDPIADFFAPKLAATADELPWRVILHPAIINRTHHMEGLYEYYGYDPLMPAHAVGRMYVKGVQDSQTTDKISLRKRLLKRTGARYDVSHWLPTETSTTPTEVLHVPEAYLFEASRNVVAEALGPGVFGPDLKGVHYLLPEKLAGNLSEPADVPEEFASDVRESFPDAPFDNSHGQSDKFSFFKGGPLRRSNESDPRPQEYLEKIEMSRPDTYKLRVQFRQPTLVVFKTTWLPGWEVYFEHDDYGVPLYVANNWMPAAIVDGGAELVFRYRPVAWVPSILISCSGLLVLAWLVWPKRRVALGNAI